MHAVLITFTSAVPTDQLAAPFEDYARALADVPGLVAKTWIADESTLGGFHLFATAAAAADYVSGPLLASVRANAAFSRFAVTNFDVLDSLSTITNGVGGVQLLDGTPSDR